MKTIKIIIAVLVCYGLIQAMEQVVTFEKDKQSLLNDAFLRGNFSDVESLIAAGAAIDGYDKNGATPLIYLCQNPKLEGESALTLADKIALLLTFKPSVNMQHQTTGIRPLSLLIRACNGDTFTVAELLPCIFLLKAYGADSFILDDEQENAISYVNLMERSLDRFSKEEADLIRKVLAVGKGKFTKIEAKKLLKKIYAYQLASIQSLHELSLKEEATDLSISFKRARIIRSAVVEKGPRKAKLKTIYRKFVK